MTDRQESHASLLWLPCTFKVPDTAPSSWGHERTHLERKPLRSENAQLAHWPPNPVLPQGLCTCTCNSPCKDLSPELTWPELPPNQSLCSNVCSLDSSDSSPSPHSSSVALLLFGRGGLFVWWRVVALNYVMLSSWALLDDGATFWEICV